MKPILYNANETDFTNNGIGILNDCLSCLATEERNGIYELELKYPVDGILFSEIVEGRLIKVKANNKHNPQLFRIYASSKNFNGVVTFSAEHISYALSGFPIYFKSINATNTDAALKQILAASEITHAFSGFSDIETAISTSYSLQSVRHAICGAGDANSLITLAGGEFEFDNFEIKLLKNRGSDDGAKIVYGKNMIDCNQDRDISESYTGVLPYAKYKQKNENGQDVEYTVTLTPNKVAKWTDANNPYGFDKIFIKNLTDELDIDSDSVVDVTTVRNNLAAYAAAWMLLHSKFNPETNISVKCSPFGEFEQINLCDTVSVYHPKLNIEAKTKVTKVVYNSITERNETIEIGDSKRNLADRFLR